MADNRLHLRTRVRHRKSAQIYGLFFGFTTIYDNFIRDLIHRNAKQQTHPLGASPLAGQLSVEPPATKLGETPKNKSRAPDGRGLIVNCELLLFDDPDSVLVGVFQRRVVAQLIKQHLSHENVGYLVRTALIEVVGLVHIVAHRNLVGATLFER